MKTSLFVLFALLLSSPYLSLKFEYKTVSKNENSQNTLLVQIIKSHSTPVTLNSVNEFNNKDKYNYHSINQLQLSSTNTNQIDLSNDERFKSYEPVLNERKIEIPVIIPMTQLNINSSNSIKSNNSIKNKSANSNSINNNTNSNSSNSLGKQNNTNNTNNPNNVLSNDSTSLFSNKNDSNSNLRKADDNEFGFDVDFQNRINDASVQSISNKEAFKAIYPNEEDYKKKVGVKVLDYNYEQVKSAFEFKLSNILEENLIGMPVDHASDIKKPNQKISITNEDFKDFIPEELSEIKNDLNEKNSKISNYRKK